MTKDADFVDSHVLHARSARLLLISTGNFSNRELETLMVPLIPIIIQQFQAHSFFELGRAGIIVRAKAPSVLAFGGARQCGPLGCIGMRSSGPGPASSEATLTPWHHPIILTFIGD